MDITKIKIGGESYNIKDETARTTLSAEQETLVRNVMTYGIADISSKTPAQLAEMAANMQQYGTPDTTGISQAQLDQMLENIQKYGIANVDGLTPAQKEALEAAHNSGEITETDPKFTAWMTSLLSSGSVDANGVLTLI